MKKPNALPKNIVTTLILFVLMFVSYPLIAFAQSTAPPDFKLPLPGGKDWSLSTEAGSQTRECASGWGGLSTVCDRAGCHDCLHAIKGEYSLDFVDNNRQDGELTGRADVDILAAADGDIRIIPVDGKEQCYGMGCPASYGNYVIIDHGNGYTSFYGHLKKNSIVVSTGHISRGAKIGIMGTSGYSTGIHLHFEIRYLDKGLDQSAILDQVTIEGKRIRDYRINPNPYYRSTNGSCGSGLSVGSINNSLPIHPNGTLIKIASESIVYVLRNGQRMPIAPGLLSHLYDQADSAFELNEVITISVDEFNRYPPGDTVASPLPGNGRSEPEGRLIQPNDGRGEVAIVSGGQRRVFSGDIFKKLGYLFECSIRKISDYDSYTKGPDVTGTIPANPIAVLLMSGGGVSGTNGQTLTYSIPLGGNVRISFSGLASQARGAALRAYNWTRRTIFGNNPQQEMNNDTTVSSTSPSFEDNLGPGTHNITLQVMDEAGLSDTKTAMIIVSETTASAPHAVISMNSGSQTGGNGSTLNYMVAPGGSINMNFNAASSQPGSGNLTSYEWRSNGTVISTASAFPFPFAAASHTITLKVTNSAGLSDTATATIRVTESTANTPQAIISMNSGGQTGTNGQTLNYAVSPGGSITMSFNGTGSQPGTGSINNYEWRSNGTVISNLPSFNFPFAAASHTITLKVTNSVGLSHTATATIIVAESAPNTPRAVISMSSGGQTGGNGSTLNYTVPPGGSISMSFDGTASTPGTGTITSYEWRSNGTVINNGRSFSYPFAAATHTITLKVTNSSGVTNTATATIVVATGTSTPQINSISPATPPRSGSDQNVQVIGSNFQSGLTVTVFIPGGGTATLSGSQIQNVAAGSFTMVVTLNVPGTYGIRVNNPDGGQSNTFSFTTQTTNPTISSISPSTPGRSVSDQNVVVNGSGFQPSLTVTVSIPGGGSATLSGSQIQNVSSTSFTMVVTLNVAGTYGIRVNNPDGGQSNTFNFTTQTANPTINSISPATPIRSGNNQNVQVSGSNFQSGLTVTVFIPGGGTATLSGSQIQSVTASSFTMVVTLNVPGTYGIRVNNPDGGQSNTFNFTTQSPPSPSISSISPSTPTRSGSNQNVQVFGSNFQSGLTVTVLIPGGGTATLSGSQIQSVTSTSFTMVITLNVSGTYGIRVNNPDGEQSNTFNFTTQSPPSPSISSISPATPTRSGSNQNVQVFGSNFQSGLTVTVTIPGGGTSTLSGSQIQGVTSTSFTMVITLNVPGTYGIRVNNPDGGQSNTFNFTTQAPTPSISSISPATPVHSGSNQNVTVFGSNFQSGLTVFITFPGGGNTTLSGSQIQSVTSNSFVMVATLGTAGSWSIRVNNPDGKQSNTFFFNVQ